MSRVRLYFAIAVALVLAIPIVTFISAMVVFPLALYAFFAVVANVAPLGIAAIHGLNRFGWTFNPARLVETWRFCGIIWIGCAYGLSHWGDVAASMGGRNLPYFKVLFAPYLLALGLPIA